MSHEVCPKFRRNGDPCGRPAVGDTGRCFFHRLPPDERRCVATASGGQTRPERKGQRCENWTIKGGTVCKTHGGSTKHIKKGAVRRTTEAKIMARLEKTYGTKLDISPLQALLDEVQWTAGHVEWLRARVQEIETGGAGDLEQDELVWGITRRKEGGDDRGTTYETAANIYLKLYQQERTHLVKVCAEAIKAGLDERMVRLAENQGQRVAVVIRAVLGDLQLTPEQQAKVSTVVPARLRELLTASAALN